jgi:hypothetical protein
MIVGFSGLAGSGKSTAAEFLEKRGFATISLADPIKRIAKQVYRFTTAQLWGPSACRDAPDRRYLRERHERHDWSMDGEPAVWTCVRCGQTENTTSCDVYLTPRFAIQTLGTEWGRRCYANTWVDLALLDAEQIVSDQGDRFRYVPEFGLVPRAASESRHTGVAIPDVRMQNELDGLKASGAPVYRIVRPAAGLRGSSARHESESGQLLISDDEFTQVLLNNGPLVALHSKVERLVFRTGA